MKRALLTSVAAVGLLLLSGRQHVADALIPVTCTNCSQELTSLISWGKQAADMARQIAQYQTQIAQLRATYEAFTHITDLGSAVGALGTLGIQNPLPISPYALQGLLNGSGGASGMLSNLSGLYTGTSATNRVYAIPSGASWIGDHINRTAAAISGTQSVALQLHQTAGERSALIAQLQARISTASTPAEREALIARLNAEMNQVQGLTVQAIATQTYGQQQALMFDQQRRERMQQSIDAVLQEARGRGIM